jgi:hypothetical protein
MDSAPEVENDPGEIVAELLRTLDLPGTHVGPDIPPSKLANARASCGITEDTRVVGLIDITVFGSAKDCMLFGVDRVWYRSKIASSSGSILYTDLASISWKQEGIGGDIRSSSGLVLFVGAAPRSKVIELFRRLGERMPAAVQVALADGGPAAERPTPPSDRAKEPEIDLLGAESHLREEKILNVLRAAPPIVGLHVAPDIPPGLVETARRCAGIPSEERVLGLLDCTAFKSAKDCLVFGWSGIYWHNGFGSKTPGRWSLSYEDMARRAFEDGPMCEIHMGENQYLRIILNRGDIIALLYAVATLFWKELDLLGADHALLQRTLRSVLARWASQEDVHLEPNIPSKKLANAIRSSGAPPDETIVGLVDCTTLGSATDCLMFGLDGLYWHNGSASKSPGPGSLGYSELATATFERPSLSRDICLSNGQHICTGSSQVSRKDLIAMLEEIASQFSADAPGLECPSCGSHRVRIQQERQIVRRVLHGYGWATLALGGPLGAAILLAATGGRSRRKCCLDCGHSWPLG